METLELADGGAFTQSFRRPDGSTLGPQRGTWKIVLDERRGPLLVLSSMANFSHGLAAGEPVPPTAGTVELHLLPGSDLPVGPPQRWSLCYPSVELELCFRRRP